jgi:large conductance mechanosensitive channel
MGIFKEFREFAVKGNVIDMAVGIIIGGAFGTIAASLVKDVIMPPVGFLMGNVDFANMFIVLKQGASDGAYSSLDAAVKDGAVTLNYGLFINNVLSFLVVALAVFFMVRTINRLKREEAAAPSAPTSKKCPMCDTEIPVAARRCPHCTSEIAPAP